MSNETTTQLITSSPNPIDSNNKSTQATLREWAPYIIAGAALISGVFLFCCIFCKCFRDGIYWCFTLNGRCQCCHYVCCCRERPIEVVDEAVIESSVADESSKSNSEGRSSAPTRLPAISVNTAPMTTYQLTRGTSMEPPTAASRAPSTHISQMPTRHHLSETARKQKYIGTLLASSRRPPPMMVSSHSATTAPPAARQVARTVKIIGDMLTLDGANKRR